MREYYIHSYETPIEYRKSVPENTRKDARALALRHLYELRKQEEERIAIEQKGIRLC